MQDKLDYGTVRVLDIEVYPNLFVIALDNPHQVFFTPQDLLDHLWKEYNQGNRCTLVTYNGLGFDFPVMQHAYKFFVNPIKDEATRLDILLEVKRFANQIIDESNGFHERLGLPDFVRHIDLVGVCPPFTSLKLLAARIGCRSIQDLPYHHASELTLEQQVNVIKYCLHDLVITRQLFDDRKEALDVREWHQKNLSDAQMAERALVPNRPKGRVSVPSQVEVFGHKFEIHPGNGSPIDPGFPVRVIDGVTYQIGLGGLHSVDGASVVDLRGNKDMVSIGIDVASYYPSMIVESLSHVLDQDQLDIYKRTKAMRLHAKATGDKQLDATLKIVLNGSFGKFGSKYSPIYNPVAMLSITLLGQIQLLQLISDFANSGLNIKVLSANTDGIETLMPRSSIEGFRAIYKAWEVRTKMVMEEEETLFVARRDVNNYFMLIDSKKKPVKTKGIFEPASVRKSPAFEIIYEAVMASFGVGRTGEIEAVDVQTYIWKASHNPIYFEKFLSVRTVNGGARVNCKFGLCDDWVPNGDRKWISPSTGKKMTRVSRPKPFDVFLGGDNIGRVVRWYIGESGSNIYTPKGGRVALTDNAVLVQDLDNPPNTPINVSWYVDRANKLRSALLSGGQFDDESDD
jgi:hypothetical protein